MAQIVVRKLEEKLKTQLRRRAARNGRSMEEEVREILRDATKKDDMHHRRFGTEAAALFRKIGLKRGEKLAEAAEIRLQIPDFQE
jgi:antitoxin FitA